MKKILIALDYSPTAQKVAEIGFSLAKGMNAQTVLLHVVTDETYYANLSNFPIMGFYGNEYFNSTTSTDLIIVAQQFLNKTKEHLGGINIETMALQGDFADVIMDTAKEQHADIIVLGSHSIRWLEKILMGSVTEKVLHETTIPLFIIPTKNEE